MFDLHKWLDPKRVHKPKLFQSMYRGGGEKQYSKKGEIETESKSEVDEGSVTRQGLSGAHGLGRCMERDELACTLQGFV